MKKFKLSELSVGMRASFSRQITAEMIADFARLTGDLNPFHETVAHGLLTSSFYSAIAGMHLPGEHALLMSTEFHFVSPVYPGDELLYEAEVSNVNTEFKFIDLSLNCTNQDGQKVIRGKMRVGVKE